jgi:hypothetical protein
MGGIIGRKTIILCIIGACIVIGFVSQAQITSSKDEASPTLKGVITKSS